MYKSVVIGFGKAAAHERLQRVAHRLWRELE